MTKYSYQKILAGLSLLSMFVLLASLYFQYVKGLHPCPLCLMQRLCVFLLLITSCLSLVTFKKARVLSTLQIIGSFAGLFFSLRQLWLQSLPAGTAPACMPGLDVLVQYFPWHTVAQALLWGAGDCAEIDWAFAGIPMPGWSALYFLFMLLAGVFLYRNAPGTSNQCLS